MNCLLCILTMANKFET